MRLAVGIDIAKKDFEACLLGQIKEKPSRRARFENTPEGHAKLLKWCRKEAPEADLHFCLESTGGYEYDLACALCEAGLLVSVENPRPIRHFALSMGLQNKTDRADARAVAAYTLVVSPRAWTLADPLRRELSRLLRHRENLMEEMGRLGNRLEKSRHLPELEVIHLEAQVKLLKEQLRELDEALESKSSDSLELSLPLQALESIPGVGRLSALTLLCEMPDVASFERAEQWASLAGLHPRRRESGQWKGQSLMSRSGNAHVRRMLYMGATSAMRLHPSVKALAERLRAKGKKPKQVRVACMRKILLIAYGVLKTLAKGKTPYYGLPPQKEEKKNQVA